MINARITWETGKLGAQTGYILGEAKGYKAKIEVFEVQYSRNPADRIAGAPWLLAHRLPFRGIERKFPTLKAAQEHAERYLVYAFELMGFADPHATLTEAARTIREAVKNDPASRPKFQAGMIEAADLIDPQATGVAGREVK